MADIVINMAPLGEKGQIEKKIERLLRTPKKEKVQE